MWNLKHISHFLRQPRKKERLAFLAWAREQAVMIDSLDGLGGDIEKLSFLDNVLENKRVVYLGEEDHWFHEKSDYRLLMLRYLISRGWTYIGEELGWSDGVRVDHYLQTGDEAYLDRIATYGYKGDLRTDRSDKATGILKSSEGNYPFREFQAEQLRLTRALRAINQTHKGIHFFGFDIDGVAGGGYQDIVALLEPVQDEPVVVKLLTLLNRVQGETLEEEIHRLSGVLSYLKTLASDLQNLLGDTQFKMLQESVLTLQDSFRFNLIANAAKDYEEMNIAMANREEVMFRHVEFVLSQMKPTDKLVLMGHNQHLSKEISLLKNAGASPPGGKRVPSIGTYINRLLPGEVFAIWELHDHGKSSQPFTNLPSEYINVPGSLNAMLAEVGANYILPTVGADLLEREMEIVDIYNIVYRAAIAKQADAIFFIREVSSLRA